MPDLDLERFVAAISVTCSVSLELERVITTGDNTSSVGRDAQPERAAADVIAVNAIFVHMVRLGARRRVGNIASAIPLRKPSGMKGCSASTIEVSFEDISDYDTILIRIYDDEIGTSVAGALVARGD